MSKFIQILKKYNIELITDYSFENKENEIEFLSKLEKIINSDIKLDFLNSDLIDIITQIELTNENLEIFKKYNFSELFKSCKTKLITKRQKFIYSNLLDFLKIEFKLDINKNENTLINLKNNETSKSSISGNYNFKLDKNLFIKKDNFNCERDTRDKAKKFNVDIEFDYTQVQDKKITPSDFILYFNKRLEYFTKLLESRVNAENVVRISQLEEAKTDFLKSSNSFHNSNMKVTIIGLISDIKETKNGHYIIELEDKSGSFDCLIMKSKTEVFKKVGDLCLDEGIGIVGSVGDGIIFVEDIIIPNVSNNLQMKKLNISKNVMFLSDLHFGAKVFVENAFLKLIDILNENTKNETLNKMARDIDYIFIAGDIIEGIGIYPNQGLDAKILSTELQYCEATRWLSQIPKRICIIIIPGNHDTSRLSEPQPKISYEKSYSLWNMENVLMLSNPAIVNLFEEDENGGLKFFIYHGGSIFYYADKNEKLRKLGGAKVPEQVIKYLLGKRHLAPSHGSTLYIPDNQKDPLVIKQTPDFFITGHTHKHSILNYKNCSIISCGCFVEMSDYQEKLGMFPDIGKVTIVNTKTRKLSILNLYEEKYKKENKEKN
jgi:DNA polymerase II small subunit